MSYDALAKLNRPSIVLLSLKGYKHFVVVKGVRQGTVVIGDPVRGLQKMPAADFAKSWNGIVLAITKPPEGVQPLYNLAIDWNPWSTAPIDANSQVASITDVTDHLPPIYQLTSQILIDVRIGTVR
jgi:predicted double-glycine peptidase